MAFFSPEPLTKSVLLMKFEKRLKKLAEETSQIEVLWLYGSQAKGNATEHSDIDLAVAFKDYEEDIIERRLRPEILAIEWQQELGLEEGKLSVVDINQARVPLALEVINCRYIILSKNQGRQMLEEQRIMSMWEIDHLYHQKHYG